MCNKRTLSTEDNTKCFVSLLTHCVLICGREHYSVRRKLVYSPLKVPLKGSWLLLRLNYREYFRLFFFQIVEHKNAIDTIPPRGVCDAQRRHWK